METNQQLYVVQNEEFHDVTPVIFTTSVNGNFKTVTTDGEAAKVEVSVNSLPTLEAGQRVEFKEKIKKELKKDIEKKYYFDEEERYLLSTFIKKIIQELSLDKK